MRMMRIKHSNESLADGSSAVLCVEGGRRWIGMTNLAASTSDRIRLCVVARGAIPGQQNSP